MESALILVIGFVVGAALVYGLLRRSQVRAEQELRALREDNSSAKEALARLESQRDAELKAAAEKLALLEEAKINLQDSFKALSSEALSKNNESFLNLAKATLEKYQEGARGDLEKRQQAINKTVEPVGEALRVFNERVSKIEERRTETDAGLREKLKQLAESQLQLSRTTGSLVQALRAPQVRGQWGELQLRRTVEMAGMLNYCDFEEQSSIDLEIYPNPSTGLVNIKASEQLERYDVYNSMGSLVASDLIMQTQTQIDLSYLSTGLYTVHVTSEAGVSEQKTLFIQP